MISLTWTAERPTVVGWYWERNLSRPSRHPQIFLATDEYLDAVAKCSDTVLIWHQWAGPIPEPAEPEDGR